MNYLIVFFFIYIASSSCTASVDAKIVNEESIFYNIKPREGSNKVSNSSCIHVSGLAVKTFNKIVFSSLVNGKNPQGNEDKIILKVQTDEGVRTVKTSRTGNILEILKY